MKRFERTIDNLLKIIDELLRDNAQLAYQLKGGHKVKSCDVICSKSDLLDYINEYDNDYIILITPGRLIMSIDREEIDKLTESGQLSKEIDAIWETETIAVAVP